VEEDKRKKKGKKRKERNKQGHAMKMLSVASEEEKSRKTNNCEPP
jgi:hypothetical protein